MKIESKTKEFMNFLYPDFMVRVVRLFNDFHDLTGLELRITEGIRTLDRQKELYSQGRDAPGPIVTKAKPGQTMHHYGVACDVCRIGKDPWDLPWDDFGRLARAQGLVWGGDWKKMPDKPHLEITYAGATHEDLYKLMLAGGIDTVWAYFDTVRGVPVGSEWYGPQKQVRI